MDTRYTAPKQQTGFPAIAVLFAFLCFLFWSCGPEKNNGVHGKENPPGVDLAANQEGQGDVEKKDPPQKSDELEEGKDFKHPTMHFEMVWVEPGNFFLGAKKNAPGQKGKTGILVTLTKGFWLAKYETTQEIYEAVMHDNPSDFPSPRHPVENLAYFEAEDFCNRLTAWEKENGRLPGSLRYHLPTEAQWEFAAKGGNNAHILTFPSLDESAWHKENSTGGPSNIGLKAAHPLGFHDLIGNVSELCYGRAAPYPVTAQKDWIGPQDGNFCIARGGGWYSTPAECAETTRMEVLPSFKMSMVGFRFAVSSTMVVH